MPLFGGRRSAFNTHTLRTSALALGLAAAMALVSAGAVAQCREPRPPVFPEFDAADLSVMEVADKRLQLYIDSAEEYLECLSEDERKRKIDSVLGHIKEVTASYNNLANNYRKSRAEKLFSTSPE